jgi:hypothetical protein
MWLSAYSSDAEVHGTAGTVPAGVFRCAAREQVREPGWTSFSWRAACPRGGSRPELQSAAVGARPQRRLQMRRGAASEQRGFVGIAVDDDLAAHREPLSSSSTWMSGLSAARATRRAATAPGMASGGVRLSPAVEQRQRSHVDAAEPRCRAGGAVPRSRSPFRLLHRDRRRRHSFPPCPAGAAPAANLYEV